MWRTPNIALFAAVLALPAMAEVDPPWVLPDCPERIVFKFPPRAGDVLLLRVPAPQSPEWGSPSATNAAPAATNATGFAVYDWRGERVRHRVVHTDADETCVLICGSGPSSGNLRGVLYSGPLSATATASQGSCRDDKPISVSLFRRRSMSVPNNWDRMAYLFDRAGDPPRVVERASFEDISSLRSDVFHSDEHRADGTLLRAQSLLLCPSGGVYRFAIDCRDAAFLFIDRTLAVSWPGEHEEGEWQEGPPMLLEGGPHSLELYLCTIRPTFVRVGWRTPDEEAPQPLSVTNLLASGEIEDRRFERIDRSLQPYFTFQVMPSYAFRDVPGVFVPVRLKNASADWVTDNMVVRWLFDGKEQAEGLNAVHVFRGAGIHRASVEVRDDLGFSGGIERPIDCRSLRAREYALTAMMTGLPAACFESDSIDPQLVLAGSLPPSSSAIVSWVAEFRGGLKKEFRQSLQLQDESVPFPMGKMQAGALERISWAVAHEGVNLRAETVRFLRPPFGAQPVRIVGDRLYDATGAQLVLLPYSSSGRFTQPPVPAGHRFGRVVCVDDFLAAGGTGTNAEANAFHAALQRLLSRAESPAVKHAVLPSWEADPGAYGPILKLVQVPGAIDREADAVILSIGRADILTGQDPAAFERRMAAISDLLAGSLNGPVVWVTPPPQLLPGDRVRPYAAAIQRVAEARGMPVADIFTALLGMNEDRHRFLSGGGPLLSENGQNLAAQLIARALLSR